MGVWYLNRRELEAAKTRGEPGGKNKKAPINRSFEIHGAQGGIEPSTRGFSVTCSKKPLQYRLRVTTLISVVQKTAIGVSIDQTTPG
jgi:hypothetical protein